MNILTADSTVSVDKILRPAKVIDKAGKIIGVMLDFFFSAQRRQNVFAGVSEPYALVTFS